MAMPFNFETMNMPLNRVFEGYSDTEYLSCVVILMATLHFIRNPYTICIIMTWMFVAANRENDTCFEIGFVYTVHSSMLLPRIKDGPDPP